MVRNEDFWDRSAFRIQPRRQDDSFSVFTISTVALLALHPASVCFQALRVDCLHLNSEVNKRNSIGPIYLLQLLRPLESWGWETRVFPAQAADQFDDLWDDIEADSLSTADSWRFCFFLYKFRARGVNCKASGFR